ncbi:insulinoma-associated protein (ia-1)-related [Clonorchis sinensis]|uniref:Insulinoma-associated protein (Ia-1)-related n=1 Tax=Clonorchis sinensis TaxID=79923 RepID=H2KV15_CLOSI|nr:insulinoma-associated protein (ia-1)-related [Clonorchis sinensis]
MFRSYTVGATEQDNVNECFKLGPSQVCYLSQGTQIPMSWPCPDQFSHYLMNFSHILNGNLNKNSSNLETTLHDLPLTVNKFPTSYPVNTMPTTHVAPSRTKQDSLNAQKYLKREIFPTETGSSSNVSLPSPMIFPFLEFPQSAYWIPDESHPKRSRRTMVRHSTSTRPVHDVLEQMKKIPNLIGDYVCQLCCEWFPNALALAEHPCSRIACVTYPCGTCGKVKDFRVKFEFSHSYTGRCLNQCCAGGNQPTEHETIFRFQTACIQKEETVIDNWTRHRKDVTNERLYCPETQNLQNVYEGSSAKLLYSE